MSGHMAFEKVLEQLRHAHLREVGTLAAKIDQLQEALEEREENHSTNFGVPIAVADHSCVVAESAIGRVSEGSGRSGVVTHVKPRQSRIWGSPRVTRRSETFAPLLSFLRAGASQSTMPEAGPNRTCSVLRRFRWRMKQIMKNPWWQSTWGVIIFLNGIFMAFALQYDGIDLGYQLGVKYYSSANDTWPYAKGVIVASEWVFGIVFTLECLLNMFVHVRHFWCDFFHVLDVVMVVCFFIERMSPFSFNASILRCFRLVRLGRLLRLVRLIEGFDALFLMTTALKGSVTILAWAMVLLLIIQLTFAVMISQLLHVTYFENQSKDPHCKDSWGSVDENSVGACAVFKYWGTFSRSLLSVFEVAFANWAPICRSLVENVSEGFAWGIVLYKLTVGFAVIGVINGVFMQETFKVAQTDDLILVRQKIRQTRILSKKMESFFRALDKSEDGAVSLDEFLALQKDPVAKMWLSAIGLDASENLHELFNLLDSDRDGLVTFEELVTGVSKLLGDARSLDARKIMNLSRDAFALQEQVFRELHHQTSVKLDNALHCSREFVVI